MRYHKIDYSEADLDLMYEFLGRSLGRVMCQKYWYNHTLPQGVSVFMVHSLDDRGVTTDNKMSVEYMFTKDEKYNGTRDWIKNRSEVLSAIANYIPKEYTGIVYYMNRDCVPIVSKHIKTGGDRHAIS
jgi:hypothetical protein|nr:MAG TPA_asm: hypothetical protein [Caudoviricetes sp.]